MRKYTFTLVVCGLLCGGPSELAAQTAGTSGQGFLAVNGGFQPTSGDFNETLDRSRYGETERIAVTSSFESGPLFDVSAGYYVRDRVAVGIGLHRSSSSSSASVTASVPHPIFFSRHRSAATTVSVLDRSELGVHMFVGYTLLLADKFDVTLFGGPSSFRLSQDVVGAVSIGSETPPFTTITATASAATRKKTVWGAHVGADVSYRIYEGASATIGAGVFARYAGASADIDLMGRRASTDVGGFQIGGGIRVRF